MKLIIGALIVMVLMVGCKEVKICETDADCGEQEWCYCDQSIMHTCTCREYLKFYEINETIDVEPNQTIEVITDKESYYEKTECVHAGDCSSNMNLSGCSYDGCNYCCNNECTVMACGKLDFWINGSKYNITFGGWPPKPTNEDIPDHYKPTVIYETVCECKYGISYCEGWDCECEEYCYNKSKTIWIPK